MSEVSAILEKKDRITVTGGADGEEVICFRLEKDLDPCFQGGDVVQAYRVDPREACEGVAVIMDNRYEIKIGFLSMVNGNLFFQALNTEPEDQREIPPEYFRFYAVRFVLFNNFNERFDINAKSLELI